MSGQHAIIAPSAAAQMVACAGSVMLQRKYPELDSEDAREGNAAHWALAETARGATVAEGQITPASTVLTAEMIDAAEVALDDALRQPRTGGLYVEQPVAIRRVHELCWGTPDLWFWHGPTLHIYDFKYGRLFVEVFENWQLIAYAAGIIALTQWRDEDVTVVMHIVQPRSYHRDGPIRTWTVSAGELRGYWNRLEMAADDALSDQPTLSTGEHCRYCTARRACPALQRRGLAIVDHSRDTIPFDLPPDALGLELRALKLAEVELSARITGLEEQVRSLLSRGRSVPHWMLVASPGREGWTADAATVITAGAMLGIDVAKPAEPLTPNQARAAGMPPEMVAALAKRPASALKLEPDDNSRARKVFGHA